MPKRRFRCSPPVRRRVPRPTRFPWQEDGPSPKRPTLPAPGGIRGSGSALACRSLPGPRPSLGRHPRWPIGPCPSLALQYFLQSSGGMGSRCILMLNHNMQN
ncbi:hypothetical protein PVAP13_8NG074803 [Panicum virgatum]|uniref:Uncharacterized protein n=1 Tax=Panicum virgatum TaxID=38727 RepID=A0A8T0P677_PANVG|nr:hypothetical protein PVAP13_8NG074803 [Panicum virgatum]